ncbi:MAG: hypothetical protein GX640_17525 [Fibrobacter sp.]|nr:hypothetical protein [Fibrobacter sp.]
MKIFTVLGVFIILAIQYSYSELPPDLPGEEMTQDYIWSTIPRDIPVKNQTADTANSEANGIVKIEKTWDAPSISEQISASRTTVPMGKGGILIPRFTDRGNEPDVEVIDPEGVSIGTTRPGNIITVEPGTYFVIMGSGSHQQKIVRKVTVQESQVTPVFPDWSTLTIETVDTNSTPFRGEYELVRIDEFEPLGRGYGADPNTGEAVNGWVLKPGTYKILGRGESYNTLKNFITVRLLPGELVKVLLVQNPENLSIVSGGTVDVTPGKKIASSWKFGANIGGTIQLNAENDRREAQKEPVTSLISLRAMAWLNYHKNPLEWETNFRFDEGINLSGLDFSKLTSGDDKINIHSVIIWRLLSWLGPYFRAEIKTNLLPKWIDKDKTKDYFCVLNNDTTIASFTSNQVFQLNPSFSPFTFDNGIGANFDALSTRFLDLQIKLGAGSSFSRFPSRFKSIDIDRSVLSNDSALNSIILIPENSVNIFEFGPQASFNGMLILGKIGTISTELKIFAPVVPELRLNKPDYDFSTIISWRVSRPVTLDYEYNYQIKQPNNTDAQVNKSTHSIWLRFSYTNR